MNRGFTTLQNTRSVKVQSLQRANLITYMNRYNVAHYNIVGLDLDIFINALSNKKLFILNNLDYELFKLMIEHIFEPRHMYPIQVLFLWAPYGTQHSFT